MVESGACSFYSGGAPRVGSCWRTPFENEQRRPDCITLHLPRKNYFHGCLISPIQRISACKLQNSCKSLRLGAAEEGVSSWEDKLESTSDGKEDVMEGESEGAWRDRIVDEEGNIDNIEQEQTRSPCEDEGASHEQWQADKGARFDNVICPDEISSRGQDQSRPQHSEASRFTPTLAKNQSQKMEGPGSARTVDWRVMAKRGLTSSSSNLWPGEDGIKEGDKGEAIVDNVHVFPSHSQEVVSPAQFQEHNKYGSSESTCDKGSLSRMNPHGYREGNAMQKDRLQEEEEKVFEVDDGKKPDDYQRRADLFDKSGEQIVARKQRNEGKNV